MRELLRIIMESNRQMKEEIKEDLREQFRDVYKKQKLYEALKNLGRSGE